MTDEQSRFFNNFCANKYSLKDHYRTFGEDNVKQWLESDWFFNAWTEYKAKAARENELAVEQWNNFKHSSYDIIAKALKGDQVTDAQVSIAKWILSGERSFIEAKAKALGEKAADGGNERRAPIIELIRKKTD